MRYTHIQFIEIPEFTKAVQKHLDDNELACLQKALAYRPDAGAVIPGSGGARKIRWSAKGRGKRGGVRVIYYWVTHDGVIWLLDIYAKNKTENIPPAVIRRLMKGVE